MPLSAFPLSGPASEAPVSIEPVTLRFELMCCPLLEQPEDADLMYDVETYIPSDPEFTCLATEELGISRLRSGLHEYYPVRFNRGNYVNLDVMLHSAVTAIRFPSMSVISCLSALRPQAWRELLRRAYVQERQDGSDTRDGKTEVLNSEEKSKILMTMPAVEPIYSARANSTSAVQPLVSAAAVATYSHENSRATDVLTEDERHMYVDVTEKDSSRCHSGVSNLLPTNADSVSSGSAVLATPSLQRSLQMPTPTENQLLSQTISGEDKGGASDGETGTDGISNTAQVIYTVAGEISSIDSTSVAESGNEERSSFPPLDANSGGSTSFTVGIASIVIPPENNLSTEFPELVPVSEIQIDGRGKLGAVGAVRIKGPESTTVSLSGGSVQKPPKRGVKLRDFMRGGNTGDTGVGAGREVKSKWRPQLASIPNMFNTVAHNMARRMNLGGTRSSTSEALSSTSQSSSSWSNVTGAASAPTTNAVADSSSSTFNMRFSGASFGRIKDKPAVNTFLAPGKSLLGLTRRDMEVIFAAFTKCLLINHRKLFSHTRKYIALFHRETESDGRNVSGSRSQPVRDSLRRMAKNSSRVFGCLAETYAEENGRTDYLYDCDEDDEMTSDEENGLTDDCRALYEHTAPASSTPSFPCSVEEREEGRLQHSFNISTIAQSVAMKPQSIARTTSHDRLSAVATTVTAPSSSQALSSSSLSSLSSSAGAAYLSSSSSEANTVSLFESATIKLPSSSLSISVSSTPLSRSNSRSRTPSRSPSPSPTLSDTASHNDIAALDEAPSIRRNSSWKDLYFSWGGSGDGRAKEGKEREDFKKEKEDSKRQKRREGVDGECINKGSGKGYGKSNKPHSCVYKSELSVLDFYDDIIDEMLEADSLEVLEATIKEKIDLCNAQTSARWSTFLSTLTRIGPEVKARLVPKFKLQVRGFWKMSMLVHTCWMSNISRLCPHDDALLATLTSQVAEESLPPPPSMPMPPHRPADFAQFDEHENGSQTRGGDGRKMVDAHLSSATSQSSLSCDMLSRFQRLVAHDMLRAVDISRYLVSAKKHSCITARSLPVYNLAVHQHPNTLPVVFCQQYLSSATAPVRASRGAKLLACLDDVVVENKVQLAAVFLSKECEATVERVKRLKPHYVRQTTTTQRLKIHNMIAALECKTIATDGLLGGNFEQMSLQATSNPSISVGSDDGLASASGSTHSIEGIGLVISGDSESDTASTASSSQAQSSAPSVPSMTAWVVAGSGAAVNCTQEKSADTRTQQLKTTTTTVSSLASLAYPGPTPGTPPRQPAPVASSVQTRPSTSTPARRNIFSSLFSKKTAVVERAVLTSSSHAPSIASSISANAPLAVATSTSSVPYSHELSGNVRLYADRRKNPQEKVNDLELVQDELKRKNLSLHSFIGSQLLKIKSDNLAGVNDRLLDLADMSSSGSQLLGKPRSYRRLLLADDMSVSQVTTYSLTHYSQLTN